MQFLSPRLQYSGMHMDEDQINEIGTSWFQFAEMEDALYLLTYDAPPIDNRGDCWRGPEDPQSPLVNWKILKNGDPVSFELLSPAFAKCRNNVYFYGSPKRKMDAASFRVVYQIERQVLSAMHTTWVWSADKTHVYRYDEVKKGLNGASFRKLDDFWGRDDSNIFCFATQRIYKNIDVDTFKVKTDGRAYDGTYHYELVPNPNLLWPDRPIYDCLDDYNHAILKKRRRKTGT